MTNMLPALLELLALEQLEQNDSFVSKINPRPLGNRSPIAYGGCVAANAVYAACLTVSPNFHIYSVLGYFLGPSQIDRKIHCRVIRIRDTRTFATRRVLAFQIQDDASTRSCLECTVDFQVEEPALLTYSAEPPQPHKYGPHDRAHAKSYLEIKEDAVRDGRTTRAAAAAHSTMFNMMETYYDWAQCLDGVGAQNVMGLVKDARTTQDHLPIYDKTSSEWLRMKETVSSNAERAAALTFLMDGGLSFLPLHMNHMDFSDAGACSTLDFALRFLVHSFDINDWHLRERKTIAAAAGRTYSEGRLWDEKGQMVAITTHTSSMRPLSRANAGQSAKI